MIGAVLAVVCPRLAPSRALVARYEALAAALRGGELGARELARRGVAARREPE